jgi:hypothetical protein
MAGRFMVLFEIKVMVKFSRNRSEKALGGSEVKAPDFLDFLHHEGGKVVALMHRLPLPPEVSWYSFLEAAEKILSDATGDRSRDPPTRNVVP